MQANSYPKHKICVKIEENRATIRLCCHPLMTAFVFFKGNDFDYSYQLDK
jgi:hypothetical protein